MLGDTVTRLLEDYRGDLRRLREQAGRDPDEERARLKAFKGLGDIGVDIFFREVQVAWTELYPFADRKSLAAAQELGLGKSAGELARHVSRKDLPRLAAALVRVETRHEYELIRAG